MKTSKTLSPFYERGGLTLLEIANMMDLTRERVRQIEDRALMKLRANLVDKKIAPADLFGGLL